MLYLPLTGNLERYRFETRTRMEAMALKKKSKPTLHL